MQGVTKADAGVATPSQPAKPAPAVPEAATPEVAAPTAAAAPDAAAQQELVADTLSVFAESVNGNDFTPLHEIAHSAFQNQVSVDKLHEVFGAFVEQQIDLSGLASMTPTLDA